MRKEKCIIETDVELGIFKYFHNDIKEKYGEGYSWHDHWYSIVNAKPCEVYSYKKDDNKFVYRVVDLTSFKTSYYTDAEIVPERLSKDGYSRYTTRLIDAIVDQGKIKLLLIPSKARIYTLEEAKVLFWFYNIKYNLNIMYQTGAIYPALDEKKQFCIVTPPCGDSYLKLDENNEVTVCDFNEKLIEIISEPHKFMVNDPDAGFDYYHYDGKEIWKSQGIMTQSLAKTIVKVRNWGKDVYFYPNYIPVKQRSTDVKYWLIGGANIFYYLLSHETGKIVSIYSTSLFEEYSLLRAEYVSEAFYK